MHSYNGYDYAVLPTGRNVTAIVFFSEVPNISLLFTLCPSVLVGFFFDFVDFSVFSLFSTYGQKQGVCVNKYYPTGGCHVGGGGIVSISACDGTV